MRRTLTPSNSPMSSPSKHGDRFIPSRAGANWSINFHRINVSITPVLHSTRYFSYQEGGVCTELKKFVWQENYFRGLVEHCLPPPLPTASPSALHLFCCFSIWCLSITIIVADFSRWLCFSHCCGEWGKKSKFCEIFAVTGVFVSIYFPPLGKRKITKSKQKSKGCYLRQWQR